MYVTLPPPLSESSKITSALGIHPPALVVCRVSPQSLMTEAGKLGLLKAYSGSGAALIGRVRGLAEGEGPVKRCMRGGEVAGFATTYKRCRTHML